MGKGTEIIDFQFELRGYMAMGKRVLTLTYIHAILCRIVTHATCSPKAKKNILFFCSSVKKQKPRTMKGQTRRSTPSTSLKTQYKLPQLKTLPLDANREYPKGEGD